MKRNSSPSSPRSAPAPDLALRPSRLWRGLALAAHLLALLVLPLLPWPPSLLLVSASVLLVSLGAALRARPWTRLVATEAGRCWLFDRAGNAHEGRLGGAGLRHPWLVTLPLRLEDGRHRVVAVWADAVPGDDHAALRRWLVGRS